MAKRARWPRALRSLAQTDPAVRGTEVHLLACHGALCTECDWRGPLRQTEAEALHDRAGHLDEGCP